MKGGIEGGRHGIREDICNRYNLNASKNISQELNLSFND